MRNFLFRIYCPYIFTLNCKDETMQDIKEEETLDEDHDVPLLMKTEIVEETIKHKKLKRMIKGLVPRNAIELKLVTLTVFPIQ